MLKVLGTCLGMTGEAFVGLMLGWSRQMINNLQVEETLGYSLGTKPAWMQSQDIKPTFLRVCRFYREGTRFLDQVSDPVAVTLRP